MAKCTLRVESLEGLRVSEDYLRGYLEAFGVSTDTIVIEQAGHGTVVCDRCYDILDRLTSMNADHQKATHNGKKLKFRLTSDEDPFAGGRERMGHQPSNELAVSGFTSASVSQEDLMALFGLYGTVSFLELKDASAVIEYSKFEAAAAALSALDGGFFRGCFLCVEYSQDLCGRGTGPTPSAGTPAQGVSRDSSWNSRAWDNCSDMENGGAHVLQMSDTAEAEEYLTLTRLSSSDSKSGGFGAGPQYDHEQVIEALAASSAESEEAAPRRVVASEGDADAETGSVITLDSTSVSSIVSTLDTDDSRFKDTNHSAWLKNCGTALPPSRAHPLAPTTDANGGVVWLRPPVEKAKPAPAQKDDRPPLLRNLQKQKGWADLGPIGIAPGGASDANELKDTDDVKYSDNDPLFESFLSFDPTLLDSKLGARYNEGSNLDFEPVVIDLAGAQMNDVKCAITGTSISATQYDQYLSMVNAYFAETTVSETTGKPVSNPIGGRFVVRDNSLKSVAFSDLSDDLVGVPLNHDTPAFVPKSHQRDHSDPDVGSVASGGVNKKVAKSTDREDVSDCDELSTDHTKGEYSIHSGQFEADIRNVFVGNIGRLMADGVQQLKAYFAALNITVLKVDIKISFAFLEVRNTPTLERQIGAIAVGSGGKPPPFGKDERMLRIEFVQQSSAGKRNIRLRREGQQAPTTSLFIVGFDHRRTPTSVLTSVFSPFGPLEYVELKNNYAFVKFVNLVDAINAQKKTHGMTMQERTLSVEFSGRHQGGDGNGTSECGDGDHRQTGSNSSVGSRGERSASSGSHRRPVSREGRGAGPHGRPHTGRFDEDRSYAHRGRGGGYFNYEHSSSPPPPPRPFHMHGGEGDRYGPNHHDGGMDMGGPHFYHEQHGGRPFPPPRFEVAPSYARYADPYLAAPPPSDFSHNYHGGSYPMHNGPPPPMDVPRGHPMDGWQREQQYRHSRSHSAGSFGGIPPGFTGAPPPQHHGRYHPKATSPRGPPQHFGF